MANIVVGDRVMVTLVGELFNQVTMSTFCYGLSSITGVNTQEAALTRLDAAFSLSGGLYDKYLACIPAQFDLTEVWMQVISPARYVKFTFTTGAGLGTLAANTLTSANAAAVIVRRGELGNRSNVSTLHVPLGQTAGCMSLGNLGADVQTPLADLATQMKAQVSTTTVIGTYIPVINHGPNVGDFSPIVSTTVKQTVRTMRRRTVGLGI